MPIRFDNLIHGRPWKVRPLELTDVDDRLRLDQVIDKNQATAVIHFAESADVGQSMQK